MGALHEDDPGPGLHAQIAGLWAAELMRLIESDGWPIDEYRSLCSTLGREISWEPDGQGTAIDVTGEGALVVETPGGRQTLTSGCDQAPSALAEIDLDRSRQGRLEELDEPGVGVG